MKKLKLFSMFLFAAFTAVFSACAGGSTADEPSMQDFLQRTNEASKVVCTTTLSAGEFMLAEESVIYERDESGAQLTHALTTLSSEILNESMYETVTTTAAVTETDFELAVALPFDASAANAETDGDTLVLQATDPTAFFGSENAASFTDVTATVRLENERPVSCLITFSLEDGCFVTIVYAYSY